MITIRSIILAASSLAVSVPALAGPQADALNQCLADNTSGRDRKEMAKWVFVAMSAHPEMKEISSISEEAKDRSNQSMGKIVTRLMSENCADQTRVAVQKEGPTALQASFERLGRLAMQELLSNPEVSASFSSFEKYVDRKKMEAALAPR